MVALLRRFGKNQCGVSAVEFALLLPMLMTLLLGTVTLFDLFRTSQSTEKITFSIGDMLSRQTAITQSRLNAMVSFMDHTIDHQGGQSRLRVSSISNVNGSLVLDWSKPAGNTSITMPAIDYTVIPQIANGDSVILTESFVPHRAFVAGFGFDHLTYSSRSIHRPRFTGKIAWQ